MPFSGEIVIDALLWEASRSGFLYFHFAREAGCVRGHKHLPMASQHSNGCSSITFQNNNNKNYSDAFERKCSCSCSFANKNQMMLLKRDKKSSLNSARCSSLPSFKAPHSDVLQHSMSWGLGEQGSAVSLGCEQGQLQESAPSVPHCTSLLDTDPSLCCWNHPPSTLQATNGFHCWLFVGRCPRSPKSICSGALVFINAPTLAALQGSWESGFPLYLTMLIRA